MATFGDGFCSIPQGTRETIEIGHMINISMYHLTALTLQSPGFEMVVVLTGLGIKYPMEDL